MSRSYKLDNLTEHDQFPTREHGKLTASVLFFAYLWSIPGGKTPDVGSRSYMEIMREQQLKGEEAEVCQTNTKSPPINDLTRSPSLFQLRKKIQEKAKDGTLKVSSSSSSSSSSAANGDASKAPVAEAKKRGRWDQTVEETFVPPKKLAVPATPTWGDAEVSRMKIVGLDRNISTSLTKLNILLSVLREALETWLLFK